MKTPPAAANLTFQLRLLTDTPSIKKGVYAAELTPSGLVVKQRQEIVCDLPRSSPIQRISADKFQVNVEGYAATFQVIKFNGYPDRITEAVLEVLSGKEVDLNSDHYSIPSLLFLLAFLPLSLIGVGGLIGGAIGGLALALNLQIVRKHHWHLILRAVLISSLSCVIVLTYLLVNPANLLFAKKNSTSGPSLPSSQPTIPSAPPVDTMETSRPAALKSLSEDGIYTIPHQSSNVCAAALRSDRSSFIVACQDGTLQTVSLTDAASRFTDIGKLPITPNSIRTLTADYFIISGSGGKFLITPQYKLVKLPWTWECIPTSTILVVASASEIRKGAINYGLIEKAAENSNNGSDPASIATLDLTFLESKDGPALIMQPRNDQDLSSITCSGINPVAFGFANGTIALSVSAEWTIEKSRSSAVTAIGDNGGFGFADGVIDTGFVDEKLRYRNCGNSAIVRIRNMQTWTIAINDAGEVWSYVPQDPQPPRQLFTENTYGPIRDILTFDYGTAIISDAGITLLSSRRMQQVLNPQ